MLQPGRYRQYRQSRHFQCPRDERLGLVCGLHCMEHLLHPCPSPPTTWCLENAPREERPTTITTVPLKNAHRADSFVLNTQVSPNEIKDVISSYSDSGDPKKIQMQGFHIGGAKYMTIRTDERSVYGKKVMKCLFHLLRLSNPASKRDVLITLVTGKRRCHLRQDHTGDSHRPLPGERPAWDCHNGCGEAGGLFGRCWLLEKRD